MYLYGINYFPSGVFVSRLTYFWRDEKKNEMQTAGKILSNPQPKALVFDCVFRGEHFSSVFYAGFYVVRYFRKNGKLFFGQKFHGKGACAYYFERMRASQFAGALFQRPVSKSPWHVFT